MVKDVFLTEPFNFNDNLASAIALLCIKKNWLPTGAPTSPVISNLVCLSMDDELNKFAIKNDYGYTRFADDLTFSGDLNPDENFKDELTSILEKYGFKLNFKKYRVLSKHIRQTVTGIVVNEKLNVNRDYKRKLRAARHNLKVNGIEAVVAENSHLIKSKYFPEDELLNRIKGKTIFVDNVTSYSNSEESTIIQNNKIHYLLFADLELEGFVIDIFSDEKQAATKADELCSFISTLRYCPHVEAVSKVQILSKKNYKLTETTRYNIDSYPYTSNGIHSVGVHELKGDLGIDWYLKTRNSGRP